MTPALINKALNQIDKIAERRIWQVVQKGGNKVEWIAPKIIKHAIEVYKTPFRLLQKFGRKKYYQMKRKFKSLFRKKIIKTGKEKIENKQRLNKLHTIVRL